MLMRTTPATKRLAETTFRVLFSLIFLGAGLRHLVRPEEISQRLLDAPLSYLATAIAPAELLVPLTGVVLVAGGAGLFLGAWTRVAALILASVLIPITVTVDLGHTGALGPLFKNVALLGGLIHFMDVGAEGYSVDDRRGAAGSDR